MFLIGYLWVKIWVFVNKVVSLPIKPWKIMQTIEIDGRKLIVSTPEEADVVGAILRRLPDCKYQRGGQHFFTVQCFFRPDWLTGYYLSRVQIGYFWHDYPDGSVTTHLKIKAWQSPEGIGDSEIFYEGSCPTFEDFKTIIRLLKFEI